MNKHSLIAIWEQSNELGCEFHGYFEDNGEAVITQRGTATNVLVDVTRNTTFHTHPDTPSQIENIVEFAGCDPPSGQDLAVLLTRYQANNATVNTDTVISRYGTWTYSINSQLFENNYCLSYREGQLLRSYYQWCQLLIICGFFSVSQYIKWVQNLDPIGLSEECKDFLSQGDEAHKFVYHTAVYQNTYLFPLSNENQQRYKEILVEPGDITIKRKLWIDFD